MKIRIIAVGQKMPAWVDQGYDEYAKRISGDCQLEMVELPAPKRSKNVNTGQLMEKEAGLIRDAFSKGEHRVALDVLGKQLSTEQLASRLEAWQMQGQNIAMVIGGPDGISPDLLKETHEKISLSKLTLPHPLVRVLLAEQLYRAWSINQGHPYHR